MQVLLLTSVSVSVVSVMAILVGLSIDDQVVLRIEILILTLKIRIAITINPLVIHTVGPGHRYILQLLQAVVVEVSKHVALALAGRVDVIVAHTSTIPDSAVSIANITDGTGLHGLSDV